MCSSYTRRKLLGGNSRKLSNLNNLSGDVSDQIMRPANTLTESLGQFFTQVSQDTKKVSK